jgi:ankyrin repeat protein
MFPFFFKESTESMQRIHDIKYMFNCTINYSKYNFFDNNKSIRDIISKHNLNLNTPECLDEYKNNMLHICVLKQNYELSNYLVSIGVNKNAKNVYDDSPLDLSIKNNDTKMVSILMNNHKDIECWRDSVISLENVNHKLNNEVKSLKRKRDDYDDCVIELKKVKTDNVKLVKDNTDLKNTVVSLRKSFKK